MKNIKLYLWFIINIFILCYFSYGHLTVHRDAAIPFVYLMILITFPSGYLSVMVLVAILYFFPNNPIPHLPGFIQDIVIPWVFLMVGGTWQWFVAIPKIQHWYKQRKNANG